ncbi:MAG: carboxymuconolactone decarboxylase family protein [Myxococcales bacterium]
MPHIPVPDPVPWYLRPLLWLTRRITGKDPLPARMLTYSPKAALGAGVFEACAATGGKDLEARTLAVARIVASLTAGCPFCLDMNAATWERAGLTVDELRLLLVPDADLTALGAREAVAARYARSLSRTPAHVDADLVRELGALFEPREIVVLATTIAQVNYWSRFCEGLGIPPAGFHDASVCPLPLNG